LFVFPESNDTGLLGDVRMDVGRAYPQEIGDSLGVVTTTWMDVCIGEGYSGDRAVKCKELVASTTTCYEGNEEVE
jgi:hypothetical protein